MCIKNSSITLRFVKREDAEVLAEIYKPYVEETAVSFEYTAPDKAEFERRIEEKIPTYPYIVAESDGEVIGYCYASKFLPRPAYIHSVETTVYVKKGFHRGGVGKTLYLALEKILALQNIISLNACIACADKDDETLSNNSLHFHSSMGYRYVGRFNASGYKFGRFYDMVWFEKLISEPVLPCPDFIPFSQVLTEAEALLSEINSGL